MNSFLLGQSLIKVEFPPGQAGSRYEELVSRNLQPDILFQYLLCLTKLGLTTNVACYKQSYAKG